MKIFIELLQSHPDDQALITENLDYLAFSNDWQGFINVCQETYAKSEREMKMCVQNLYQFSHDAKVLIQGSDDYQKIVSPKVFEFIAHNKGKTVDELTKEEKEGRQNALHNYSWQYLTTLNGLALKKYYNAILAELGKTSLPKVSSIYAKAVSSIDEPKNLQKIILKMFILFLRETIVHTTGCMD